MRQEFLVRQHSAKLTVFFAGWGMDAHPFKGVETPHDLLLCYDYTDLSFDERDLKSYQEVTVVAWSMGVWAAGRVLATSVLPIKRCIAINGTLRPVDDKKGIPHAIFQATLDQLNLTSLLKFYRRMCGSKLLYERFLTVKPQRDLEDIRWELEAIGKQAEHTYEQPGFTRWTDVIIGTNDRIFPADNQRNAWESLDMDEREIAHYNEELFKQILHDE